MKLGYVQDCNRNRGYSGVCMTGMMLFCTCVTCWKIMKLCGEDKKEIMHTAACWRAPALIGIAQQHAHLPSRIPCTEGKKWNPAHKKTDCGSAWVRTFTSSWLLWKVPWWSFPF
jgi:hypothetical protein